MRSVIILLTIFISLSGFSQNYEEFSFVGALKTTSQLVGYKIDIVITDGVVTGKSIMDIDGPNQTGSAISGRYDYKTKTLSFKETKVLYSKASLSNSFCYIYGSAKMETRKKKTHLDGVFWGLSEEKDSCAAGSLNMVVTSYVMNKMANMEKMVKKMGVKDSVVLENLNVKELRKKLNYVKVTKSEPLKIDWTSESCVLKFWDDGIVDGDVISVKLNGNYILYNYTLQKIERELTIQPIKGMNVIEISAQNNGKVEPNTANVLLEGDTEQHKVMSYLNKGENAYIQLYY